MKDYYQTEMQSGDFISKASAADSFGCCSSYRECSNAKMCLIPDREYSVNCLYRRNLEAGRIFYGKNANNFNRSIYDSYVSAYFQLSENEKESLKSLLHIFLREKRLIPYLMLIDKPEFDILEQFGFIRTIDNSQSMVDKCTFKAMISACGDRFQEAILWAQSSCPSDEWGKRRSPKIHRDELASWIKKNCPEAIDRLQSGIRCVALPSNCIIEIEEFFLDFTFDSNYKSNVMMYSEDDRFMKNM